MTRARLSNERGLTVLEVVVAVVVFVVLLGFLSVVRKTTTVAAFTTSPATVRVVPASGTFIYNVKQRSFIGTKNVSGRSTTFTVYPAAGVRIMSLNGTNLGTQNPNGSWTGAVSGTAATDNSGDITVVVQIDYVGSARLQASDDSTSKTTDARFMGQ